MKKARSDVCEHLLNGSHLLQEKETNAPPASRSTCAYLKQMGPSEVSSRQKALRDPLERKQREMTRTASREVQGFWFSHKHTVGAPTCLTPKYI